jgi:hypothetical protein
MNVNKFKQMIEKSKVEKKGRSIPNEFILLFLLALFFAVQVFFVGIITVELFKPGFSPIYFGSIHHHSWRAGSSCECRRPKWKEMKCSWKI